MDIAGYLDQVITKFETGQATEHSYRAPLERLFESISDDLTIINEPKRSDAGMPDFIFQRKDVPVGWVEAKDIDKDVIALKGYSKEQRKRYEAAFPNLIYTNGVDFEFIREGVQVHFVSIADFVMGLQPKPENFDTLERQLRLFAEAKPISIRSAAKLADMMAAKAAIIKDEIDLALKDDPNFRSGLGGQFKSFQQNLLPNLTPGEFADIYAETITYGMFAARFHDDTLDTFSRQEALEKLPASNPFLKGLFEYIAGPQLPSRIKYIVDDLAAVMRAADPHALFEKYGEFTARNDPFIHFYEDFLAAYNPKKRKSRGVWYTPEPVVDFIVRAVDDVLKTEFGLPDGLADTSKVTVDWDTGTNDPKTGKARTIKKEVHKVQILDPATGTGTFLAKTVQLISDRVKKRAPGMWSSYVENDLLPRLHGFELLMASYAMCHMKLDMQLTKDGYVPSTKRPDNWPTDKQWPPRLSVWLTNALEPAEREIRDLFFPPLAAEARGASEVKRQTPIMCVLGNPPYSINSMNRGDWIEGLNQDFKVGLEDEDNISPLSDDYVKFIRMASHTIEQSGRGVAAYISNNSYMFGIVHRAMRAKLLQDFDKIYVLNLHGNSNIGEVSPDGSTDENVFDIRQGVGIIVLVRRGLAAPKTAPEVFHADLYGKRSLKNEWLYENSLKNLSVQLNPVGDRFYFIPHDAGGFERYEASFSIDKLFRNSSIGTKFRKDNLLVRPHFDRRSASEMVTDVVKMDTASLLRKYRFSETKDWEHADKKRFFRENDEQSIAPVLYRQFDRRFTYYPRDRVNQIITRGDSRINLMRHMTAGTNIGLATNRQIEGPRPFTDCLVVEGIFDLHALSMKESNQLSPLYLYPDDTADQADALAPKERTLNLDPKLYAKICKAAGIDPADTAGPDDDFRAPTGSARPSEVKIFDYIYGVLHSPDYRKIFSEFLKIDFPRVPYPASPEVFRHVSEEGEALRRLHLMEDAAIGETYFPFTGEGSGEVASGYPKFEPTGKVHINPNQYFESVPQTAWEFHIGGYQPAQKWLKDRRGRTLSWEDVGHYQKIVKILIESDRIMREINLPFDVEAQ